MKRVVLLAALAALSTPVLAERQVWVNGKRMNYAEIAQLERLRCGPVPNGRYWLNLNTGIWGYGTDPRPQGHISDNCNTGRAMNRRGPFGDYMSDGKCSFVNGVPVGRC
jgi:hypothetical protein